MSLENLHIQRECAEYIRVLTSVIGKGFIKNINVAFLSQHCSLPKMFKV